MAHLPQRGWLGYGVDLGPAARPGVPRERHARARQERRPTLRLRHLAAPARGLSGAVRRLAYGIPEHRAGRWALLLVADRIDVVEHRATRGWWVFPAAGALALGYVAATRALARR